MTRAQRHAPILFWILLFAVSGCSAAQGGASDPLTPPGPAGSNPSQPTATVSAAPLPPEPAMAPPPTSAAPPRPRPAAAASESPAASWLGVSMRRTEDGVMVDGVLRGSPAASAGLQKGDRLVRIGGSAVSTPTDVAEAVSVHPVGTRLDLDIRRGAETRMLYAVTIAKPNREDMIRNELLNQPAPSISSLRTVQGSVVPSWVQLKGQVVVLEFWASWCVVCRALAPTLNDWHQELSPSRVQILGITMDPYDEAERASRQLEYPTFSDESGDVTMSYQGTALPTVVVVDRAGIVRDIMVGLDFERLPQLKQTLVALAAEK